MGSNRAQYQSCVTALYNRTGMASYLAGFSTVKGVLAYHEEGTSVCVSMAGWHIVAGSIIQTAECIESIRALELSLSLLSG